MRQVAHHFNVICQYYSSIYCELSKSRYDGAQKMRYSRFVAVCGKNETTFISCLDSGHPNVSRSQTSNRDLP
jgi:hypothetical protein